MIPVRSFCHRLARPMIGFVIALTCGSVVMHGSAHAEMRTREGTYIRLTSDIAEDDLLNDLVDSFDAAVPQWVAFWGVPIDRVNGWRIDGYLMGGEERFRSMNLLPAVVPHFQNGFASPAAVWIQYQSTTYYNRHLVLHEGVHSLAIHLFGGGGPSWYMEGTAELLATHRDRVVTQSIESPTLLAQTARRFLINDLPRNRKESPMWGRYRVIEESRKAKSLPTLASVLKLPMNLDGDVHSYAWCWAAALMLTSYPDTRDQFIRAAAAGRDQSPAFTMRFYRDIQDLWPVLRARWKLWLHELEYGFEPQRSLVRLSVDDPRHDGRTLNRRVDASRGWQSAGVWFPEKSIVQIRADGRCLVANEASLDSRENQLRFEPTQDIRTLARDWMSTPSGITAHYHRGFPIGQLQVAVLPIPNQEDRTVEPLDIRPWNPSVENTVLRIEISRPAWLVFRINDAPGIDGPWQRADNQGTYQVVLQ